MKHVRLVVDLVTGDCFDYGEVLNEVRKLYQDDSCSGSTAIFEGRAYCTINRLVTTPWRIAKGSERELSFVEGVLAGVEHPEAQD